MPHRDTLWRNTRGSRDHKMFCGESALYQIKGGAVAREQLRLDAFLKVALTCKERRPLLGIHLVLHRSGKLEQSDCVCMLLAHRDLQWRFTAFGFLANTCASSADDK